MTKINNIIKAGFLGTVGLVGSLIFINKYKTQPHNQSIPPFFSRTAPDIFAPILLRKSAVSTISGSRAAFSITVVPFARVAAIIIDKVAPTLTFSITIRVPTRRSDTCAFTYPSSRTTSR